MKYVKQWQLQSHQHNRVDLLCDGLHVLHLFILEPSIIRVAFKPRGAFVLGSTWSIDPEHNLPWKGRDRLCLEGFSRPDFQLTETDSELCIETSTLRLVVHQPLWLEWFSKNEQGAWQPLASDRNTGAYQLGVLRPGVAHFMQRDPDDFYFGLGEKTGDLNRTGRRFEMRNLDAMGYDASKTDPLYKHIPFYITYHQSNASFGIFYDNLANCWFDLGNELDNYHRPYRSYRAEDGDLDYYFIAADSIKGVTQQFTRLTGGTAFGPRWSLGYSGSTMQYTDAPNAQQLLQGFVDQCVTQQIPCDSFQLSSGYTSIGNKRYVFHWNHDKVPNSKAMSGYFHDANMQLAANIKPCLLHDHPLYTDVKAKGLFIRDQASGEPETSVFWDADGSHLDFTNPATIDWWQTMVTEQLLKKGIDSTWNDNNEFEIWDRSALCNGFGQPIEIGLIRPLQPLLMMRASYEAQLKFAPTLRPYLISRSGCPGMNRYVQTWSGDNRTNWTSLRYNIRMGLGMSLSGLYNIGHDVGGFSGERPDPELFVRWVQNGVMHPRFTIHSWNDDGSVNEPWMYPEVTPLIRDAIALRYRLLPYFYHLLWRAHSDHEPMLRPTFLDHEHDPNTLSENDDFMLGEDLLVASVVEAGQRQRPVYLPNNGVGWYDFHSEQWYSAGQWIKLDAPLERLPLLVKAGTLIPTCEQPAQTTAQVQESRTVRIYPLKQGICSGTIFDDDGQSFAYQQGEYLQLHWTLHCHRTRLELEITSDGNYQPIYRDLVLQLPAGENRPLWVNGVQNTGVIDLPL